MRLVVIHGLHETWRQRDQLELTGRECTGKSDRDDKEISG